MLGDTFTGKTSLVLRFAEGHYREEGRSPTVGAFFITKRLQVNGITCKIQIWDTAGQTQFRPMAPMYYKSAAAAIVCYDVSSPDSYQTMRYWLDELHRNVPAGSIVIAIAATKTDLIGSSENVVPSAEAEAMANAMGAIFVDTSSKVNTNVNTLFRRVAERVLQFRERARRDGTDVGTNGVTSIPVTPGAIIGERGQVVKKGVTPEVPRSVNMNGHPSAAPLPVLNSHGLVDSASANTENGKIERRSNRSSKSRKSVRDDTSREIRDTESADMVEPKERSCGEVMACGAFSSFFSN